ncbi:hypothetical protein SAMN05443662_0353 [Sulfurivirga caldicuralii]|uniref:Dihydroorotate dehydrogenase electron transfer subunit n=1 Tax=Sulfurivirga caldicuralii TaxID=364032 RepID=A0A1N6DQR9_9GAMM|nr:hypothetical protein [Sulfurivirga caldicuralii]SIN73148.1 hypothetical protein SAMN05443662_0353 [Sulfurivirga caldicuralii]
MPAAPGIFAELQKVGDPPVQAGFFAWRATLSQPLELKPGQWLASPDAEIGWLGQTNESHMLLVGPEDLPERILLTKHGEALAAPDQAIVVGVGLPGLGGVLKTAQEWKGSAQLIALLQLDALPFQAAPSRIWLPGMPSATIATLPLLEDWKIPCRLAADAPGCFEGDVHALLQAWRASGQMPDWPIYAFGA